MRLSNLRPSHLIRLAENGVLNTASFVQTKAEDLRCAVSDKFSAARLEVKAIQLADLRTQLKAMPSLDRQEIELRASEITMVRDAAAVLRQEKQARRELARKILRGELTLIPTQDMVATEHDHD